MKKLLAITTALVLGFTQLAHADVPSTAQSGVLGSLNAVLGVSVSAPAVSQQYCSVTAPSGIIGTLAFLYLDGAGVGTCWTQAAYRAD